MCWPIFCRASLNSSIFCCRALVSEPLAAVLSSSSLVLTSLLTSSGIRASLSLITFSAWWIMWSAWLRSSTSSRLARSSAECASASLTIRSTSSLFRVEDEGVLDLALEHPGLNGGPDGDHLVRVDSLVRLLAAEQVLDELLDDRHAGGSADQHDLVDLLRCEVGVFQRREERPPGALGQVAGLRLELGSGEGHLEVLGTCLVRRDERQVDGRLEPARELDLRPLRGLGEALQGLAVGLQVDSVLLLELVGEPVHDPAVVVVTTEVGVPVRGLDLEDAVAHVEHGDVEGATAEVENEDRLVRFLFQAVCQGSRGWFIDDPQDVEAGDLAGVLGRLAL